MVDLPLVFPVNVYLEPGATARGRKGPGAPRWTFHPPSPTSDPDMTVLVAGRYSCKPHVVAADDTFVIPRLAAKGVAPFTPSQFARAARWRYFRLRVWSDRRKGRKPYRYLGYRFGLQDPQGSREPPP